VHNYKKLEVWKESVNLVTEIYVLTNDFPDKEKFGLISQINRCAVSIPSNIAEGAGRSSKKEFSLFLGYSLASSFELETQLIISSNLKFISEDKKEKIINDLSIIQRKIYSLIKSLKK
jgi:four helix bundle protein